jgi:hypothetical protein
MTASTRFLSNGWRWSTGLIFIGLLPGASSPALAQSLPPPTPMPQSQVVEGTMKKFYRAANTVLIATVDGAEHVYHFAADLVVHGGKGTGPDALESLQEGAEVVVHYTIAGDEAAATEIDRVGDDGLAITEGIVARVDRRGKQITIRFYDGKTETLRLTDRAAAEAGPEFDRADAGPTRVVVYYKNEAGQKVAHFFKKIS